MSSSTGSDKEGRSTAQDPPESAHAVAPEPEPAPAVEAASPTEAAAAARVIPLAPAAVWATVGQIFGGVAASAGLST